jgi:hypothetical protein
MDKNTLDVVLVGASTVYAGGNSMTAWKKYGMTSYAYSSPLPPITLTRYLVKDIKKSQKPKLFVFEIQSAAYRLDDYKGVLGHMRTVTDVMPYSKNRTRAIKYTLDTIKYKGDRKQFYFPPYIYHNSYKDKKALKDLYDKYFDKTANSNFFGTYAKSAMFSIKKTKKLDRSVKAQPITAVQEKAIVSNIKWLKKNKIPYLFVVMPQPKNSKWSKVITIKNLYKKHGVEVLDLNEKIKMNADKDFRDSTHLNYYGSKKFTDYLSKYLKKNYKIPAKKTKKVKTVWNEEYKKYAKAVKALKK